MRISPSRIISMASLYYDSCVLFAAIELGIFAKLAGKGAISAEEMASLLNVDREKLRLLLNACVAEGLLKKEGGKYNNTEESETFLVPGKPGDLSDAIKYNMDVYPLWKRIPELVRTGKPVESPHVHLGGDKERTKNFVMAMHRRALAIGNMVMPFLEVSNCKKVLDVGGGSGAFSILLARKYPQIHCAVIDLPPITEIASQLIKQENFSERIATVGGDYHTTPFPPQQDAILFLGVLHQESPTDIETLLRKAYDSLSAGGIVYVMDMMTDHTHTSPKFSALFALNMALTAEHGWVFSDAELAGWMKNAGFVGIEVKPLPEPIPHWLACGRKNE